MHYATQQLWRANAKALCDSLDIDLIDGQTHGRLYKKLIYQSPFSLLSSWKLYETVNSN